MTTERAAGVILLASLAACGSGTPPASRPDGAVPDASGGDGATPEDTAPMPVSSGIGEPCEASGPAFPPQRGSCAEGQICLTRALGFQGGYCTAVCTTRCPADAACVRLPQNVSICMRRCAGNNECRGPEGYVCGVGDGTSRQRVCRVNDEPVGTRENGEACFTTSAGPHRLPALGRTTFPGANASTSAPRFDSTFEAEGNIVVNPRSGRVANTYIAAGGRGIFMGVSRSMDGNAWVGDGIVSDTQFNTTSDPVLDYGRDGVLRMVFLGVARSGFGQPTESHVRIAESRDDGATFGVPRRIEPENFCGRPGAGTICDKPWIVSGPSALTPGAEALYVGYMVPQRVGTQIVVQRSDNGGQAWTEPVVVASTTASGVTPNLIQLAVGANGALGAAWAGLSAVIGENGKGPDRFGSPANQISFRRSRNGGQGWEPTQRVSRDEDSPVYEQPPVVLDGDTVHVAYVSGQSNGAWDIILATSPDGGANWRYRKVNDEPERCATHMLPAMVLDPATRGVHLLWIENRFGDGAVAYARCPRDPALRCTPNEAVSDASFRFTTSRQPNIWHGDYVGLTIAASGELFATWSDTRAGGPGMYAARGRAR